MIDPSLQQTCKEIFFKLSAKHQTLKEVLSVFKQFMVLQKKGRINADNYHEYKEYVSRKIEDALGFEGHVTRFSEALGGL